MTRDHKIKTYLLSVIAKQCDSDGTQKEQIAEIRERFKSEMNWRIAQAGETTALYCWLQGCALNVAIYNSDIYPLMINWGFLTKDSGNLAIDNANEKYWHLITAKLYQIFSNYRMPNS